MNEIKKMLYREKPTANLIKIYRGSAYYGTFMGDVYVAFVVPVSDMGDAEFLPKMDAKLLIRWIKET